MIKRSSYSKQANPLGEDGRSKIPDWELESTARQLVALAEIREPKVAPQTDSDSQSAAGEPPDFGKQAIWRVLTEGLRISAEAVRSAVCGKVGLALSGGGFRASLFHIGVLAKLAELDVLRHVEVLSCVSGGSIIGAHYYLELRHLLKSKPDAAIAVDDYVEIVQRIAKEFLAGVQSNLRTQVLAEPGTAWRIMSKAGFSETERLGELYVEKLFNRIPNWEKRNIALEELKIQPQCGALNFNPKLHNWTRQAKVPTLILNATTLNSCHNWQFTASWMGESPALIDTDVDGNDRLRRRYHKEDAPEEYQTHPVRLGQAVAASACVPGLFAPLTLPDLYPEYTVRLVDGGVFDNQGAAGLVEQDCTVLLVSDASGQTGCEGEPEVSRLGVLSRSNNILMARVREAQYHDQLHRLRSRILRGLMFLHLRKDLKVKPVDWLDCADPFDGTEDALPIQRRGTLTTYGVRKDVQEKLAALRTDLDAFSDLEAYSLMTSGYLMAASEFPKQVTGLGVQQGSLVNWPFLSVKSWMSTPGQGSARVRLLDFGRYQGMKYWRMSTGLRLSTALGGVVAFVILIWLAWATWPDLIWIGGWLLAIPAGLVLISLVGTLAVGVCPSYVSTVRRLRERARRFGFGVACLFLSPFACLYLKFFNGRFLKRGKI